MFRSKLVTLGLLFSEEEERLSAAIEAARQQVSEQQTQNPIHSELEVRFEEVAAVLRDLDIEAVWSAAEDQERRILVEELVEWVSVFPDHLEVTVTGSPPLHFLYQEVGVKKSGLVGVGGPTGNLGPRPVILDSGWSELRRSA